MPGAGAVLQCWGDELQAHLHLHFVEQADVPETEPPDTEDMAGKSGPLAGTAQIRPFITPYYGKIWGLLQERGARLFEQDSDGDMNPAIDAFLDASENCMHPMEPAANMDIVNVREQYGTRLAFHRRHGKS